MGLLQSVRNSPLTARFRPSLEFFLSFAFLNAMVNLRFPGPEPPFWWLVPSGDVVVVFWSFAVLAWAGWKVPRAVQLGIVAFFLCARFLRLGDGISLHYFLQPFNAYADLPLLPELVRLGHSILPAWQFYPLFPAFLAVAVAMTLGTQRALQVAERYLAESRHITQLAVVAVLTWASAWLPKNPEHAALMRHGFGASVVPRLRHETRFLLNVIGYESEALRAMDERQAALERAPHDLGKLGGANVFLIFIESYGETTFARPLFRERLAQTLGAFEREADRHGFAVASGVLDSSTTGGRSWLAHTTLLTGLRATDQLTFRWVLSRPRRTLPGFFRDAGYTTLAVEPGTTRERPVELFRYDRRYSAAGFDYAGPPFAWATMPDQYVLDFVRRREDFAAKRRIFAEYVLVSSHAPWSHQPALLEDWDSIENGALYGRIEMVRYPIRWPEFANASEAYVHSIAYDLEVLRRYLTKFVDDDSLWILLGDHQPVPEVAQLGGMGVPVHVLSKNRAFIEPFLRRGYRPGMKPDLAGRRSGMEDFMVGLLNDFSAGK
jgi:hypothetical protein